jgi:pimeloyl-ACP methyl ester carboxylesterase
MGFIEVQDVRLWFTDSGEIPGDTGPPLLLVHGWTCDSHDWSFQLDAFAAVHRVLAVDLRGHGRSSAPERDYTAQRYAADLAELLARLTIDQVVVVGHSLGASVAAALAVQRPQLVRAAVSVEPAYGQDEATVEWMRGAAMRFGDEEGNALAAELQGATEPLAPAWLRTWHRRRTLGTDPALLRETFWDMYFSEDQFSGQPQTDAYLAGRRCPTLAFHRFPHMADWERGVTSHPESRVVSWEGAGHWLHQQYPVEFNSLVLTWIAQLADAGAGDGGTGPAAARSASSPPVALAHGEGPSA